MILDHWISQVPFLATCHIYGRLTDDSPIEFGADDSSAGNTSTNIMAFAFTISFDFDSNCFMAIAALARFLGYHGRRRFDRLGQVALPCRSGRLDHSKAAYEIVHYH